jgi:pimeloyl-ACP methyl ester carboxylesterase
MQTVAEHVQTMATELRRPRAGVRAATPRDAPRLAAALTLIAGAHRFSLEGLELLRHDHFEALDAEMQVCYRAIHPDGDAQIEAIFSRPRGLSGACREFSVPPAYLPAAKSRTLLVFGDRDEYFPMEIVTELARALPNAELWVVPGQGHTPVRPTFSQPPAKSSPNLRVSGRIPSQSDFRSVVVTEIGDLDERPMNSIELPLG